MRPAEPETTHDPGNSVAALALRGVLFRLSCPEFDRWALEVLLVPLGDGHNIRLQLSQKQQVRSPGYATNRRSGGL